jgi:hypothetical protein
VDTGLKTKLKEMQVTEGSIAGKKKLKKLN